MFNRNGRLFKNAQNSSDPVAVLNAGWNAMQAVDPRLAKAVSQLPPQMAQQAVLQYTNAIRMGNEAEAGKIATDYIRNGFAEMPSNPAPANNMRQPFGSGNFGRTGLFARIRQAKAQRPTQITDLAAFEAALVPKQLNPDNPLYRVAQTIRQKQPALSASKAPAAYQQVKDQYARYNSSGKEGQLWDTDPPKDLTVPADWTPTIRTPNSGLINNASQGLIRQGSTNR